MQAYRETTVWVVEYKQPNHVYLLDGDKAVAYIKWGQGEPFYFSKPMRIDKRGRKFELVEPNPFNASVEPMPWIKQVAGSKPGVFYTVNTDENTCTCPGYTFRGACKHTKELETV